MKENIISFTVAKLAKEKGFKELCFNYYNLKQELQEPYLENGSSTDVDFRVDLEDLLEQHNNPYHNTYSAPTQSLLQKWLREVHNIYIEISVQEAEVIATWYWKIFTHRDVGKGLIWIKADSNGIRNTTYEEALEKGLLEALKLIKIK